MATTYFRNPQNGYTTKATGELAALWTFLLGPFYLGYKGLWGHAFLLLLTAVATAGIAWLVYPFLAGGLIRRRYLEAGWQPVDRAGGERALPGVRGPSLPGRVVRVALAGMAIAVLLPSLGLVGYNLLRRVGLPLVEAQTRVSVPPPQATWTPAVHRETGRGPK